MLAPLGAAAAVSSLAQPMMNGIQDVPLYRKRMFMVIGYANPIFAPFAFLSAVTGPLYWNDDGAWRKVSGGGKFIYIIWAIFGTALLAAL